MAKSKSSIPVQTEMFVDPLTAEQLYQLVQDKIVILKFALGKLEKTFENLERMMNSECGVTVDEKTKYNYEFFSPTTVHTQLQLKLLV